MEKLFQHFSFVEASFTTFVTYTLDGQLHKEFFDSEQKPMRTYCLWEDVQAQCFSIIKGKRTPLNFKIVFQLSSSNVEKLLSQSGIALKPEDIYGLYLNCQFDGKQLLCTTGTSLKFSPWTNSWTGCGMKWFGNFSGKTRWLLRMHNRSNYTSTDLSIIEMS